MPGDSIEFNALLPLASDDVYAAGSWFTGGAGYGPLILHFDGTQWTIATQDGGGGPMLTFGNGSVLALGNPSLFWNGAQWTPQPGLSGYDYYSWSSLHATGPCNAVGSAVVDIASTRRSVAVELKPIVYKNGFD
jgi:hypothetical protein